MKVKIELAYESVWALVELIEIELDRDAINDYDRLMLAGLMELLEKLKLRMVVWKKDYPIKLTPVQAIALAVWYRRTDIRGEHFNNQLRTISDRVSKQFV